MWKSVARALAKIPEGFLILIICALVAVVGIADYYTGQDILISFFFLVPILIGAWVVSLTTGVLLSILCAIVWVIANTFTPLSPAIPAWIIAWNAAIMFGFFLVSSVVISALSRSLAREQELAHADYLTGILNSRAFHEQATLEIARAKRSGRPFTIAYFDLENLKAITEQYGQIQGDKMLRFIGRILSRYMRVTDVIGRMSGEEFIILFSETDQQHAYAAIARLYGMLTAEIHKKSWPLKISMGVLTCNDTAAGLDNVLREVDKMMYEAKKSSTSQIAYRVLEKELGRQA